MGIKNYREKPALRYNGHHRQRLRKIEVKLKRIRQYLIQSSRKIAAEMEEKCQKNSLKKRKQQEILY